MKKTALAFLAVTTAFYGSAAQAATLAVSSASIDDGKPIDTKFAYCMPDGNGKTKNGGNVSPQLSWSGVPEGTKSFTLIAVDPDVPASFELANQAGKAIPVDFARRNFYHWVLYNIPAGVMSLAEGQDSQKVIEEGKPVGKTAYGISTANDYGKSHGGYDGPCPPWNDMRLHHYHFIVYALDVNALEIENPSPKQVEDAMQGHILAKGEITGTYTNNPSVR